MIDKDVSGGDRAVDQELLFVAIGHAVKPRHHRLREVGEELGTVAEIVDLVVPFVDAGAVAVPDATVKGVQQAVVGAGQNHPPPFGVFAHKVRIVVRALFAILVETVVEEEHRTAGRVHHHRLRVVDITQCR